MITQYNTSEGSARARGISMKGNSDDDWMARAISQVQVKGDLNFVKIF